MKKLTLRLACWDYDRTRPLIDGRVRPDGIELNVSVMRPREAFTRMLEREEFDVAEVSLATYAKLKAAGDRRFVGIPVALSRMFRHSCIYVRADAGIKHPRDLRGRRVGASSLESTGVVFIKGMLAHDYGVRPDEMQWVLGGLETAAAAKVPPGGHGSVALLGEHESLNAAFAAGSIDGLVSNHIPSLFLAGDPRMVRLFPDYKNAEQDYVRRTGLFPIMHTVALRADVHSEFPQVAGSIYRAFCEARDVAMRGLYDTDALRLTLPWLIDHVEETRRHLGTEYWSYGVAANRSVWTALCEYLVEQQLSARVPDLSELFVVE